MNYILGLSAGSLLLAAAVEPIIAPWAELGAVGLIGGLLWWHLTKLAPQERQASRLHMESVVRDVCSRFDTVQEQQWKAIREMIADLKKDE